MSPEKSILTPTEAGGSLRQSYDKAVDNFFGEMDITYNNILKQNPGMRLTDKAQGKINQKLAAIKAKAENQLKTGITRTKRSQASEILKSIQAFESKDGTINQAVQALRDIGDVAFKTKGTAAELPSDVKALRDIYSIVNDGIVDSTRSQLGDNVANSLISNNKAMEKFFGETSELGKVIRNSKISDEKVLNRS